MCGFYVCAELSRLERETISSTSMDTSISFLLTTRSLCAHYDILLSDYRHFSDNAVIRQLTLFVSNECSGDKLISKIESPNKIKKCIHEGQVESN